MIGSSTSSVSGETHPFRAVLVSRRSSSTLPSLWRLLGAGVVRPILKIQIGQISRPAFYTVKVLETRDQNSMQRCNVLASTSPPRQSTVLPIPVRTTEQYCSLLQTTCSSRLSINSREVLPKISGMVERVSNL